MTQQTSPFIEGKYGWALGEGNWNLGMDENLLKFSYLFDRNIDGIVSSLPTAVNGTAYFNTTDNRIYFAAGGVYSSTPVPKWFEVTLRSSGQVYQFDGNSLVAKERVEDLAADLANKTNPLLGSALSGFDPTVDYPEYTIGAAVNTVDSRSLGLLADGSDETAKLTAIAAKLVGSGVTLVVSSGILQINASVTIEGFHLKFAKGAALRVYGTVQTPFINGALRVKTGGVVSGGEAFTSGSMVAAFGSSFASRPCVIYVDGGELSDMTVYSQIYGCVKYSSGKVSCKVVGGVYGGFAAELTADIPYNLDVEFYNSGVSYVDRTPFSYVVADCRAVYVRATVTITNKVTVNVRGDYCTKNAVWVQGIGGVADNQLQQLLITGNVTRAGYYKDASNVTQLGDGAGTCLEILNAPNVQASIDTSTPQGYNVALASGCHGAQVTGLHRGNGGDPVVVVVNSNNCSVSGELVRGTVGVSVGEDGAASNNTKVSAIIRDMSAAPVLFDTGFGIHIEGCVIDGEPTLGSYTGNWSGPGEVRSVVVVKETANDVTFAANSVRGWFTHDVIDRSSITGRLRVTRIGNRFVAPILDRDDISFNRFGRRTDSCKFIRVLDDSDTTGHAGVGEISLPAAGATFASFTLNPLLTNLTDFNVTGTDLASVRKKYAVLVYMKYVPAAVGRQVTFSIQTGGGTVHSAVTFFGTFGVSPTPIANSIQGVLHNLADGEWVPLVMNLDSVLYTGADPAALTHFLVFKNGSPATYDLTITKPVLVYVGEPEK